MESARLAADRLRLGDVPAEFGLDPAEAQRAGEIAYRWRNYLAVGALGPDLFFLLPDFKQFEGLVGIADFVLDIWDDIEGFFDTWERWMGPVGANDADLAAQLTGGLSQQLGAAVDSVAGAIQNAVLTSVTRSLDVFGLLTSGIGAGYSERTFFWSDMVHYRRTYEVPRYLYEAAREAEQNAIDDQGRQDAEALQAFALGWMCHCATDVVGHSFTNAKSGGPFRLHWQRHHLVENHFDSAAYSRRYGSRSHYDTIGTSALHFRIAFRRNRPGYPGREDAPMYDYFGQFPQYPTSSSAIDAFTRSQLYSVAPGLMPDHLKQALGDALRAVYTRAPDITPRILEHTDPTFSDGGRPSTAAMDVMWRLVFRFLAHMGSSGHSIKPPPPPAVIRDHPFPTPPGGASAAADPDRGADVDDEDVSWLDVLLAIFAWVIFLVQVVIWLVTVLPGLVLDVLTFPARLIIHYTVIAPLHSLLMAARKLLTMTGFITPETVEIDPGLVTLGHSSAFVRASLRADLNSVTGFGAAPPQGFDEPSGRPVGEARHADPAYPRDTPRDPRPVLDQFLALAGLPPLEPAPNDPGDPFSEWVFPWRYPERDVQGFRIGWEGDLTHAGPYLLGEHASALLARSATDVPTTNSYEDAHDPDQTEEISSQSLGADLHMGSPVDYTLYLFSRFHAGQPVPSFNLDSDRGYAWKCWDWNRHRATDEGGFERWVATPLGVADYQHTQPCTPPAQFDPQTLDWVAAQVPPLDPANVPPEHRYDGNQRRLVQYLDFDPRSCGDREDAPIRDDVPELQPTGEAP